MRRSLVLIALFLVSFSLFAQEPTLPQLFQTAKEQFGARDYRKALVTLDRLDQLSMQPGFETDRRQLEPAVAFYRGASHAALGDAKRAREQFTLFLSANPGARLAAGSFPKDVIRIFDETRLEIANRKESLPSGDLRSIYAAFEPSKPLAARVEWADSPVRYLLTAEQKEQWQALGTTADREAFIDEFWAAYDPTEGTEENELRREFEKRIQFSDTVFSSEEQPGSLSDRAVAFIFLGPPTHIGRAPLRSDQSPMEALRGRGQGSGLGAGHQTAGAGSGRSLASELEQGVMETWYYRKGDVPQPVGFPDLELQFISKKGYGEGVMQKDPPALQSIALMATNTQKTRKLVEAGARD